jgi:alpha-mannosidase
MRKAFFPSVLALLLFLFWMIPSRAQGVGQPDLAKQPTLYVVGYAHLDTEWRWEYPQVIREYLRNTMEDNFKLFDKYPHYIFNFSGANRYRLMKEYYPAGFARMKKYVAAGRWFPAGASMEEGDVNIPSAEAIIRQILYGNEWFNKELGKSSTEFLLPDTFGFPASIPSIAAHCGLKGFSTQKLRYASSADGGGSQSIENTPEGFPFNVGVWVGPDGKSVIAALNPGPYSGDIYTDFSKPLPPLQDDPEIAKVEAQIAQISEQYKHELNSNMEIPNRINRKLNDLREHKAELEQRQKERAEKLYQIDWASRVLGNGKATGLFTDYHYYGTGDLGGAPPESSVKRLEAILTKGQANLPVDYEHHNKKEASEEHSVQVGDGPVNVIAGSAEQMFLDITPKEAAGLPRYTGEMQLTYHSAGSANSQTYQKRWIRQEELLADAAEKSSVAALWLGARKYPLQRLNDAWTLALGAHFHDLAAGTATPRAYEFAWNDDVIAMNQFAGVLNNAAEAVAAGMNTETAGEPLVVFNPLNVAREDLVEAKVDFPTGMPESVRVTGPDGKPVPAQISEGKVIFLAKVPSVGFAVYGVQPGTAANAESSQLRVTSNELENKYYRVHINSDGDVASIFDKQSGHELLSAPARLAISYDSPKDFASWNMEWEQEQAAPKSYVSGPAQMHIVENGPARVAIEVSRTAAGSRFVQTISLAAGDAGKRVDFGNVIDWNTRESNLKATFPLAASNQMATYNMDIGTIMRPSATPKKFEVPSHQWVDLTDAGGEFGATILTDSKLASDKPNDNTIRLTLMRSPRVGHGDHDQATQDIGHHEFVYGIAGHANGWRDAQTDWQAQRLNAPLVAFQTTKHAGTLAQSFSLVKVSNPRVRILALKKAELSDEIIVRMVELDGKPQPDVHIEFAAPLTAAREVNGQEQPVGPASIEAGELVTKFSAYQPRTFAVHLGNSKAKVSGVKSVPVALTYEIATASNDGDHSAAGMNGKGDAFPAEMLPTQIAFNDVRFDLAPAKTGVPNALVAKGQTIKLPTGRFNRVYLLAASSGGDQKATFEAGGKKTELNIQDWGGFVGQWDNRVWSKIPAYNDFGDDTYGEMVGLKPGFIKRADLAWYCSHHHNEAGENVPYAYSYLFAYGIDLPVGVKSLTLPENDKIRILAISVADENPEAKPAQALYDVLPSSHSEHEDYSFFTPARNSVPSSK